MQWFLATPIGMLLLFGWSAALFFHFFAGIRHLVWDAGYGSTSLGTTDPLGRW